MKHTTQNLFSDFDFFDKLLNKLKVEPTLNFLKKELLKDKNISFDKLIESEMALEKDESEDIIIYNFFLTFKNNCNSDYNPTRIGIIHEQEKDIFKVLYIHYENNCNTLVLYDGINLNDLESKVKIISLINEEEGKILKFNIFGENAEFEKHESVDKVLYNYLSSIKETGYGISVFERILLINTATLEQQETELLENDFILENCTYSGKLNKAQDLFKEGL